MTVTLIVGEAKKHFVVHDSKLFSASPAMHSVFSTEPQKTSRTFDLPDTNPELFNAFIHWLYSGKIDPSKVSSNSNQNQNQAQNQVQQRAKTLATLATGLYILGEKFQVVKLKNEICRGLVSSPFCLPTHKSTMAYTKDKIWLLPRWREKKKKLTTSPLCTVHHGPHQQQRTTTHGPPPRICPHAVALPSPSSSCGLARLQPRR